MATREASMLGWSTIWVENTMVVSPRLAKPRTISLSAATPGGSIFAGERLVHEVETGAGDEG